MFDSLQSRLEDAFRRLRGEGTVTEATLDTALRQIRTALLEADVNFRVVKAFVERIRERAAGQEVLKSLTPAQQVIKIVRDELTALLGERGEELRIEGLPSVTMLCGLQGSGKTTTAGKLALRMKSQGRSPLLVACDLQRAAAVEQLRQVGSQVDVPVLTPEDGESVLQVARRALTDGKSRGHDLLILDTAGRLHIDSTLMDEVKAVAEITSPTETLFVADAMTGQDAVKSAKAFGETLPLTGVILTKLDGDSRGGAALSVRTVVDVPIRYIGTGEKLENLDLFHPDRMASRILGMGDVLSLIERAEQKIDQEESERLVRSIAKREFTLEELRDVMRQFSQLGGMGPILEMMPKVGPLKKLKGLDSGALGASESKLKQVEAVINSMTPQERRRPAILNAKRKKRIARGSGTRVQDVNQVLKMYQQMRKTMRGAQGKWMRRALGGM